MQLPEKGIFPNVATLARAITRVENELNGSGELLSALKNHPEVPVIGITGPPGAGKSTLVNALTTHLVKQGAFIGIIAVDPTSPFNYGSLLGDRVRMADHFLNDQVFIRSLASRGSLGGLSAKILEIVDVMRNAWFDYIIVETVGVGQSEVEITGLADTTLVTLVPEAGDEIQTLKSGLMEIADIFVVNKSDREGADSFVKNLSYMLHEKPASDWNIPIIKTVASKGEGIEKLLEAILAHRDHNSSNNHRKYLLAEKAYRLIEVHRMKNINREVLARELEAVMNLPDFNLYIYIQKWLS